MPARHETYDPDPVALHKQLLCYAEDLNVLMQQLSDKQQLEQLAYHDGLTGLPNRRLLEDRLQQTLSQAQRLGIGLSVLFIDLDHFKPVNDKFGHAVGDQVLQEVSRRLGKSVRQGDTVARLGGDEFVLLLPSTWRSEDVAWVANTVLRELSEPITIGEIELTIGASIGCARYPQDGSDSATLLKNADSAMYLAKRANESHFCFFDGQNH